MWQSCFDADSHSNMCTYEGVPNQMQELAGAMYEKNVDFDGLYRELLLLV